MPLVTLAVLIIIWCVMFYKIFHEIRQEEDIYDDELDNWDEFDENLAQSLKKITPALIVIFFVLLIAAVCQN